jgi:hypothetical protein
LTVSITNEDASDFIIESIEFKNSSVFSHTNTLPSVVRSGESYPIKLTFAPDNIFDFQDSIIINITSPCSVRVVGKIKGSGIVVMYAFFPDTSGNIGDADFCIPIYSYFETNRQIQNQSKWQITISHDARIFLPDLYQSEPIINGRRVVDIQGGTSVSTDLGILTGYCGTIMLGDKDFSSLEIIKLQYQNPNVITKTINGSLTTNGLCIRNLSRLATFVPTTLTIAPNPVNDILRIDYHLSEDGKLLIELIENSSGSSVSILAKSNVIKGDYMLEYDVSHYPSGVYFVSLTLNNLITRRMIVIIK